MNYDIHEPIERAQLLKDFSNLTRGEVLVRFPKFELDEEEPDSIFIFNDTTEALMVVFNTIDNDIESGADDVIETTISDKPDFADFRTLKIKTNQGSYIIRSLDYYRYVHEEDDKVSDLILKDITVSLDELKKDLQQLTCEEASILISPSVPSQQFNETKSKLKGILDKHFQQTWKEYIIIACSAIGFDIKVKYYDENDNFKDIVLFIDKNKLELKDSSGDVYKTVYIDRLTCALGFLTYDDIFLLKTGPAPFAVFDIPKFNTVSTLIKDTLKAFFGQAFLGYSIPHYSIKGYNIIITYIAEISNKHDKLELSIKFEKEND